MKKKFIGVFIPNVHKTGRHDYVGRLCHIANEEGYRVICFSSFTDLFNHDSFDVGEKSIYNLALNIKLSGLVVYSELIKDESVNRMLIEYGNSLGVPVFSVEKQYENAYYINYDYESAIEQIVLHVIDEHNARNICFMSGIEGNSFSENRNAAYKRALEARGIEFDESKIYYGQFWDHPAVEETKKIVSDPDNLPDAIVCANDTMAIAVCDFLRESGFNVPADIIVTGLDGIERGQLNFPKITTACCNYKESARYILDVIEAVENGAEVTNESRTFGLKLDKTQSCGCVESSTYLARSVNSQLNSTIATRSVFSSEMNQMVLLNNDGRGLRETLISLRNNVNTLLYRGMQIYIDPGYFDIKTDPPSNKILAVELVHGTFEYRVPFTPIDTSVICSQELIDNHYFDCIICVPLHCMDKVYGYISSGYNCSNTEDGERLYNFTSHLNILLSSIENNVKLNEMLETLNNMYIRDPLTNLYNRRGFNREIDELILCATQSDRQLYIISSDLDVLKTINDSYGHSEGDYAIITVAEILSSLIKEPDKGICARFGGDEYLLALVSDKTEAELERLINESFAEKNSELDKEYSIGASIGIERLAQGESIQDAIKRADVKMYKNKRRRKLTKGFGHK